LYIHTDEKYNKRNGYAEREEDIDKEAVQRNNHNKYYKDNADRDQYITLFFYDF